MVGPVSAAPLVISPCAHEILALLAWLFTEKLVPHSGRSAYSPGHESFSQQCWEGAHRQQDNPSQPAIIDAGEGRIFTAHSQTICYEIIRPGPYRCEVEWHSQGESYDLLTRRPGAHFGRCASVALAIAQAQGAPLPPIITAIAEYPGAPNCGQWLGSIDDDLPILFDLGYDLGYPERWWSLFPDQLSKIHSIQLPANYPAAPVNDPRLQPHLRLDPTSPPADILDLLIPWLERVHYRQAVWIYGSQSRIIADILRDLT